MAENKRFGYLRVSSREQCLDRQRQAMQEYGINERDIFTDKQSGKDTNRPQYQALKQVLRAGDTVVIKSIDRLGRNYDDIKNEWNDIVNNIGAEIEVIDMPILNTNNKDTALMGKVISDVVLTLLGYVAEQERAFIKRRQAEGIRIAVEKGKFAKANKIKAPEGFEDVFNKAVNGGREYTHTQAMKELNLNKTTYYRIAKELGLKTAKGYVLNSSPSNSKADIIMDDGTEIEVKKHT